MTSNDITYAEGCEISDRVNGCAFVEAVVTKDKKKPKTILKPMTLDFPSNSVTAILGPSGSGKSTLLSLLTDSLESNVQAVADGASTCSSLNDHMCLLYILQVKSHV